MTMRREYENSRDFTKLLEEAHVVVGCHSLTRPGLIDLPNT
jgi:hypothetical protein